MPLPKNPVINNIMSAAARYNPRAQFYSQPHSLGTAAQTALLLPQARPSPRKQHFPNRRQDPRRANSASPAAGKTLAAQTAFPLPQARPSPRKRCFPQPQAKPAGLGQGHMPQPKPARRQQQAAAAFPCQQARPAATGKIKKPERTYMRPSALLPSVYKELHASKRDNFFIFCVILNQRTHK